jgi:hypothetical protein
MGRLAAIQWVMALTAVVLTCGCGRGSEPSSDPAAPTRHAPAAPGDADLVSAVSAAGPVGPVGLKFRVPDPPRVGQPSRLELVLTQESGLDISHMLVSLQPGDGLKLDSERSIAFDAPAPGATQRMVVSFQPEQQGLLNLNATVLVDAGTTSLTRSFSIPLIAGP